MRIELHNEIVILKWFIGEKFLKYKYISFNIYNKDLEDFYKNKNFNINYLLIKSDLSYSQLYFFIEYKFTNDKINYYKKRIHFQAINNKAFNDQLRFYSKSNNVSYKYIENINVIIMYRVNKDDINNYINTFILDLNSIIKFLYNDTI